MIEVVFNESLKALEEKRSLMEKTEEGIKETFKKKDIKVYEANLTTCSCTFHIENQVPCRHILLERELQKLFEPTFQLFDIDLFNPRYHRSLANALETDVFIQESDPSCEDLIGEEIPQVGIDDDYGDEEDHSLSDKEKFNLIIPHMTKIANLILFNFVKL